MRYTVEVVPEFGETAYYPDNSRRAAIQLAKSEAADHPDCNVFISWHRSSDGQTGYLNRDGNHAITGEAW